MDLGRALGAFVRELSASDAGPATERCQASGLDAFAANNLIQYLTEQKQATEVSPTTPRWWWSGSTMNWATGG